MVVLGIVLLEVHHSAALGRSVSQAIQHIAGDGTEILGLVLRRQSFNQAVQRGVRHRLHLFRQRQHGVVKDQILSFLQLELKRIAMYNAAQPRCAIPKGLRHLSHRLLWVRYQMIEYRLVSRRHLLYLPHLRLPLSASLAPTPAVASILSLLAQRHHPRRRNDIMYPAIHNIVYGDSIRFPVSIRDRGPAPRAGEEGGVLCCDTPPELWSATAQAQGVA